MRILHIVGGLPSEDKPYYQPFIKSQIDSIKNEGIDTVVLEIKGHESFLNYFKSILTLRKIIKIKKIDLIHAHYSYSGWVAFLAKVNIPKILSLMGSDLLGRPDKDGRLTLHGKIDRLVAQFIAKRMDHIIVKSEHMKNQINTTTPISIIPNGVELNLFKPKNITESRRNLSLNQKDFIILFLGDPQNPRKNFKLAKISVELFRKISGVNNVKFIHPYGISQEQILEYMNAADILLVTSYWEGSPNIIKEAMACNLPIIATNVGDISEIITNTVNCFVTSFSETEIVDKLNIIYSNTSRSNGRDRIGHLEISFVAKRIIALYEKLISKNRRELMHPNTMESNYS